MIQFGQVWSILSHFIQLWSISIQFDQVFDWTIWLLTQWWKSDFDQGSSRPGEPPLVLKFQIWLHHSNRLVERSLFWNFQKIAWKTKKKHQKNHISIWNTMPSHAILWDFIVFLSLTHHSALFFTKLCLFNTNTGKMTSIYKIYHDPMWSLNKLWPFYKYFRCGFFWM